MNRLGYLLTILASAAFLSACTERIEVELDDSYTRLVVDGAITTDTMAHKVILTNTTSYFYNQPPPGVSGAVVTISDGIETFALQESPEQPGVYLTDSNVYGVPGRTYTLHIKLAQEINGFSDFSASSALNPVAPLDSIGLRYLDNWEFWEIQCYALDPPTRDFYMFKNYTNGKLNTDTINEIFVTDDRLFNGSYTNGAGTGYLNNKRPDEAIHPGDTIKLQISGITEAYMKLVVSVQTESGYKNPLFSGPPANVKGNISNGAVGFFTAYSASYATVVAK
jgi:hypothetical protein